MTKSLDLTPDQQAKIQPIFDQAKPQVDAVRQDAMQKIRAIRENTQAQIRPILTPAQQQKFDALKKAREDMRKARQEMRDAMKSNSWIGLMVRRRRSTRSPPLSALEVQAVADRRQQKFLPGVARCF